MDSAIEIADETYLLKDQFDAMVTEMINLTRAGRSARAGVGRAVSLKQSIRKLSQLS